METTDGSTPVGITQFSNTIDRLYNKMDEVQKTVEKNTIAVARLETTLKIKGSVWGLLGGLIPAVCILLWLLVEAKVK